MGDDFIDKQKKRYKRQQEQCMEAERKQLCLSETGKEIQSTSLNFKSHDGKIAVGEKIILADVPGESLVRAMRGVEYIGHLDEKGSAKVQQFFSENQCLGGFIHAVVDQPPDLSGYHQIKIEFH